MASDNTTEKRTIVSDAVRVRSWLVKLDRGNRMVFMPRSLDHELLRRLVRYIEKDMRTSISHLRKARSPINPKATKRSVYVRERRRADAEKLLQQIHKYFEIHGDKSDGNEGVQG